MPKIITSPVEKWPGTVTLSDPLNYLQDNAWADAIGEGVELQNSTVGKWSLLLLPVIFQIVEKWDLDGIDENPTIETFPATPREPAYELITWLVEEVRALYEDGQEVPNA